MKAEEVRVAKCALCGAEEPSSPDLPYFRAAREQCTVCGFFQEHHVGKGTRGAHMLDGHKYTPEVPAHDTFWCGCRDNSKSRVNAARPRKSDIGTQVSKKVMRHLELVK